MTVYFIRSDHFGRVKIGHTKNTVQSRLNHASFCFSSVRVVAEIPGAGKDVEQALHRRFAYLAVRDVPGKEIFERDHSLDALIDFVAQTSRLPDRHEHKSVKRQLLKLTELRHRQSWREMSPEQKARAKRIVRRLFGDEA